MIINDESHQPEIGVQLQVNCTKNYYEDSVSLQIEIQQDGINVTTPITAICKKAVTYHPVKFLECDKGYDLIPYWTSDTNKRCDLNSENFNKKVPCSGNFISSNNIMLLIFLSSQHTF